MTIENFAAIPFNEQVEFANTLINKINAGKVFSEDANFEVDGIEADEFTGGLSVRVALTNPIKVSRSAVWTCGSEEEAEADPGYGADYENLIFEDVKKAFKTLSTVIDGYKVSLEVDDADEYDTIEVRAEDISHEDSGVGDYEYWGVSGHDSQPYVEVSGTIVKECDCALTFYVEPADTLPDEA